MANCLPGTAPVVGASDYVRGWPQLIAPHVQARLVALGTDGFGCSDSQATLRCFFEVERHQIVLAARTSMVRDGGIDPALRGQAIARYGIAADWPAP